MSEQPTPTAVPGLSAAESERMKDAFKDIAERSQKLLQDFAVKYKADGPQTADPLHHTQTFMDLTAKMLADPNRLVQAQMELWQQYMNLWQVSAQRMMGQPVEPMAEQLPPIAAHNASSTGTDLVGYLTELFGFSSFVRDDGAVYHTYSTYARGLEFLMGYYPILDRAPKGRDEGDSASLWIRRHDEYGLERG